MVTQIQLKQIGVLFGSLAIAAWLSISAQIERKRPPELISKDELERYEILENRKKIDQERLAKELKSS